MFDDISVTDVLFAIFTGVIIGLVVHNTLSNKQEALEDDEHIVTSKGRRIYIEAAEKPEKTEEK